MFAIFKSTPPCKQRYNNASAVQEPSLHLYKKLDPPDKKKMLGEIPMIKILVCIFPGS